MTTRTIDDTKMEKWLPIPKVDSNFFLKAHFSNFGGNFHNNFSYFSMDFKEKIFSLQFYVTIGAFSLRPCILLPKHRLWPK